jgi:hypothetical protein
MSTRSTISVKTNGIVKLIYCHSDGYPSHHLPILRGFYHSQRKAESLVALGNLSVLAISPDCPPGHSFANRVEGYCVAYNRDRGENGNEALEFATWKEAQYITMGQEYNYYWNGKLWRYEPATQYYRNRKPERYIPPHYVIKPSIKIGSLTESVPDEIAEFFGIYEVSSDGVGGLVFDWLFDFPTRKAAQDFIRRNRREKQEVEE